METAAVETAARRCVTPRALSDTNPGLISTRWWCVTYKEQVEVRIEPRARTGERRPARTSGGTRTHVERAWSAGAGAGSGEASARPRTQLQSAEASDPRRSGVRVCVTRVVRTRTR